MTPLPLKMLFWYLYRVTKNSLRDIPISLVSLLRSPYPRLQCLHYEASISSTASIGTEILYAAVEAFSATLAFIMNQHVNNEATGKKIHEDILICGIGRFYHSQKYK
jgi:hypothetical protein